MHFKRLILKTLSLGIILSVSLTLSLKDAFTDSMFEALRKHTLELKSVSQSEFSLGNVGKKLDEDQLINILESNDVYIVDRGGIFDRTFLTYLYFYFIYLSVLGDKGPIYLHESDESGPILVSKSDRKGSGGIDLYFAKNSGDKIPNRQIEQILEYMKDSKEPLAGNEIDLTIEYSNEIFEQLTGLLTTSDDLTKLFKAEFGFEIDAKPVTPDKINYGVFTKKEKLILLKSLHDLPQHLFSSGKIRVKKIMRTKPGFKVYDQKTGEPVAAQYDRVRQTIIITDLMYVPDDPIGDRCFYHELGHAIWDALNGDMRFEWLDMNFEYDREKQERVSKDKIKFLTAYSTKVEENFPEYLSAYICNREFLEREFPEKYAWLKKNIFLNYEYFADGAKNIKIFVSSDQEDVTPPVLMAPLEQSVKVETEILNEEEFALNIDIFGLFDDLSGISEISLELKNGSGPGCYFTWPSMIKAENCIDPAKGHYRIKQKLHRRCFSEDKTYGFYYFSAEDAHGNTLFLSGDKLAAIKVPGKYNVRLENSSRNNSHPLHDPSNFAKIKIDRYETTDGKYAARITLPVKNTKDLGDIDFGFYFLEDQGGMRFAGPSYKVRPDPKSPDSDITFKIMLPYYLPKTSNLYLSCLTFEYSETEQFKGEYLEFCPPDGLHNLKLQIKPIDKYRDATKADFNANDIKMQLVDSYRYRGQDLQNVILVKIPIQGIDKGRPWMNINIQTPEGHSLRQCFPGLDVGEDNIAVIPVALPAYHEEGEYILRYCELFEAYEDYWSEGFVSGRFVGPTKYEYLLERGIRATVKIKIPLPEDLEKDKKHLELNSPKDGVEADSYNE